MSIAPCGIHDQDARVFANGFGKSLGTIFYDNISPTNCARECSIQWRAISGLQLGYDNIGLDAWFSLGLMCIMGLIYVEMTNLLSFD